MLVINGLKMKLYIFIVLLSSAVVVLFCWIQFTKRKYKKTNKCFSKWLCIVVTATPILKSREFSFLLRALLPNKKKKTKKNNTEINLINRHGGRNSCGYIFDCIIWKQTIYMDVTAQLLPCIQLFDIQFKLGLIHKGIRNEIIICIYLFNLIFIRKKKKKIKKC